MRIKTIAAGLLLCIGCLLPVDPAFALEEASGRRIFDNADLFTDEEEKLLEEQVYKSVEEMGMDLAVVTTSDASGKSPVQFADDYYDANGFGIGEDSSGALYLIDMDNRELYISTHGGMIRYLTDDRIEVIIDEAAPYAGDGDYSGSAQAVIRAIEACLAAGVVDGQYNYDWETGSVSPYYKPRNKRLDWYEILFAFAGAGILAALPCISTINQYQMKKQHKQSLNYRLAYRGASSFAFHLSNDQFFNKQVSQRRIPRNTGSGGNGRQASSGRSTTHRSSSGRSHGGGGRKF